MVSVPNNVVMQDFEIAELFGVMIPTIRANIRTILKTNIATADLAGGATLVATLRQTIMGWIWLWLLLFGFSRHKQRFSENGYSTSVSLLNGNQ